jgi:O-antigen/teichoic acid export membrane protein
MTTEQPRLHSTGDSPAPVAVLVPVSEAGDPETAFALPVATGRNILRNSTYTIVGQILPALAAIVAVPQLIKGLGNERFGFLMVAFMMIGYFSVLDLGMGRALTQRIADMVGRDEKKRLADMVWTALGIMLLLGLAGAVILTGIAPVVCDWLRMSPQLKPEAVRALLLLSWVTPIVILNAGFRAILEGHLRFDLTNLVGGSIGCLSFVAPVVALHYSHHLPVIVAVLAVVRIGGLGVLATLAMILVPTLRNKPIVQSTVVKELLSFGGWITVSAVMSPLMVSSDRFLIGSMISIESVAFYTTPFEVVSKFLMLPAAIATVLFPTFAISGPSNSKATSKLFFSAQRIIFLGMFPLVLLTIAFAREGLQIWAGPQYAEHSTVVARWLAFGVIANGLSLSPYVLLQGLGKPKYTAITHCVEAVIYFPMIYFLIKLAGIQGAAVAWVLRVTCDGLALHWLAFRDLPLREGMWHHRENLGYLALFPCAFVPLFPLPFIYKVVAVLAILATYVILSWKVFLTSSERLAVTSIAGRFGLVSSKSASA